MIGDWTFEQAQDLGQVDVNADKADHVFIAARTARLQQVIDDLDHSGTPHIVIDIISLLRDQLRLTASRSDSAIVPFDRVGLIVKYLNKHFKITHRSYGYTNVFARICLDERSKDDEHV